MGIIVNGEGQNGFLSPNDSQQVQNIINTKAGTSITAGTGALLYTVTSGKVFYLTHFSFASSNGTATTIELQDSTTISQPATQLVGSVFTDKKMVQLTFPTPIRFSHGFFLDLGTTSTVVYNIIGWEESKNF
jgi:microcystin-dependent protein